MPPSPDQEVLFSLSLPLVAAVLLLLGLMVAVGGWLLARRRRPVGTHRELPPTPANIPWLSALLEALPCGAVLADGQARVRLANGRAGRWLGEAGRSIKLPHPVQALVRRVAASGVSEGLEAHAPSGGDHQLWIEVAALGRGGRAGTSRGDGVLLSKNGCRQWRQINDGLGRLFINTVAIDPQNPDRFYAGTADGAYVSFDGGAHWVPVNDGLLGGLVVYSIAVDLRDSSNVYAATPLGIFKLESR